MGMHTESRISPFVIAVGIVFFACSTGHSEAQKRTAESQALYDEISRMDSALTTAYNAHDLDAMKRLFSSDLEFYHDKGGLLTFSQSMDGMASNFQKGSGIRRELVKGTLEVYPIPKYGAIEIGVHRFCHVENGADDCGSFKFVHVWQKMEGRWMITRVISYDH